MGGLNRRRSGGFVTHQKRDQHEIAPALGPILCCPRRVSWEPCTTAWQASWRRTWQRSTKRKGTSTTRSSARRTTVIKQQQWFQRTFWWKSWNCRHCWHCWLCGRSRCSACLQLCGRTTWWKMNWNSSNLPQLNKQKILFLQKKKTFFEKKKKKKKKK